MKTEVQYPPKQESFSYAELPNNTYFRVIGGDGCLARFKQDAAFCVGILSDGRISPSNPISYTGLGLVPLPPGTKIIITT